MQKISINFKDCETIEGVKEIINQIKTNPISKWWVEKDYGSFNNFEKESLNGWYKYKNTINQEQELENMKNQGDSNKKHNLNTEQKIMRAMEKLKKNDRNNDQQIVKNCININKKCKIFGHKYIKDGTEGIIKDVVDLTQQYVVTLTGSDINYIDFKDVKIMDEWKDIVINGESKEFGKYNIRISRDGNVKFTSEYNGNYNTSIKEIMPFVKNTFKYKINSLTIYVLNIIRQKINDKNILLAESKIKDLKVKITEWEMSIDRLEKEKDELNNKNWNLYDFISGESEEE